MPYVGFSYVKRIRSEVTFNQSVIKRRIHDLKNSLEESKEKENTIVTEISFYERELEILEKVEKLLEGETQYV